jgi:NAD+ synthase
MGFDAKKQTENIIEFVREYYRKNNLGGAVLGVSGGKDSGIVLAILVKALGKENVVGLTLPCHSIEKDKDLAHVVANHYGVKLYNLDLTAAFDAFTSAVKGGYGEIDEKNLIDSDINLKPRLRMASLYYYAAMLTKITGKPYLVAGTSNKCELFVGYFTKGGDNVHDIATIADFTVSEVIKIGEYLGVPNEVLYRTPSDGLSGVSDEDKLGVKYSEIEQYLIDKDGLKTAAKEKIEKLYNSSRHKFNIPTYRKGENE